MLAETFGLSLLASLISTFAGNCNDKLLRRLDEKEKQKVEELKKRIEEIRDSKTIDEHIKTAFNKSLKNVAVRFIALSL